MPFLTTSGWTYQSILKRTIEALRPICLRWLWNNPRECRNIRLGSPLVASGLWWGVFLISSHWRLQEGGVGPAGPHNLFSPYHICNMLLARTILCTLHYTHITANTSPSLVYSIPIIVRDCLYQWAKYNLELTMRSQYAWYQYWSDVISK